MTFASGVTGTIVVRKLLILRALNEFIVQTKSLLYEWSVKHSEENKALGLLV